MHARVTWIGHASAMVDLDGDRVLIDPLGRRRCRRVSGYSAVLITHSHVDHLNRWTLSTLDKSAQLIVPVGAEPIVADLGFARIREVEPGDEWAVGGLNIACVPTKHDSGRWRKGDMPLCGGYIIEQDSVAVHHAGDVDMSDFEVFEHIGARYKIDTTLLPIGGLLPPWYYRMRRKALDRGIHIDPDTALAVAQRLGAKSMVPVHWGTVNLRLGRPSAPRRRLTEVAEQKGLSHLVRVMNHGDILDVREQKRLAAPSEAEVNDSSGT